MIDIHNPLVFYQNSKISPEIDAVLRSIYIHDIQPSSIHDATLRVVEVGSLRTVFAERFMDLRSNHLIKYTDKKLISFQSSRFAKQKYLIELIYKSIKISSINIHLSRTGALFNGLTGCEHLFPLDKAYPAQFPNGFPQGTVRFRSLSTPSIEFQLGLIIKSSDCISVHS